MKIRNIIVGAACVAAGFAAVAFSGCSGGHTVTVMELTNGALSGEEYSVRVDDGEKFTWDALLEEYPGLENNDTGFMRDGAFYTDDDCLVKYTAEVTSDIALYFGNYSPAEYGKVVFNYGDGVIIPPVQAVKVNAVRLSITARKVGMIQHIIAQPVLRNGVVDIIALIGIPVFG